MFCDLVGSTALAAAARPEELRDLMQAYQRACGEVIERYDGHVAQYLGDGLMVYFGWPRAHEDDAVRAMRAGLEIVAGVSKDVQRVDAAAARASAFTPGWWWWARPGRAMPRSPRPPWARRPTSRRGCRRWLSRGSVVVSERTRGWPVRLFDYADLGAQALKGIVRAGAACSGSCGARATESRFEASRSELALTPLVGREEEIALLLRRWQQAKDGEGQVVLVGGEPGIGKSRLTQVLRERHRERAAHRACATSARPITLNSALYPVIEQFERAAGFTREDSAEQKLDKMRGAAGGKRGADRRALRRCLRRCSRCRRSATRR